MPSVVFSFSDGRTPTVVEGQEGWSIMEIARQEGIPGIDAECGGGMICCTCHIYVGLAWLERVGTPDEMEAALLDMVPDADSSSRLCCQIILNQELDGIQITVPQKQFKF